MELFNLGKEEIEKIGLVKNNQILDGMILREQEAYPIYDEHYEENLKIVLDYLSKFSNLLLMGRNGLHSYINMDIAMLSAMEVVDKIVDHERKLTKDINFEKYKFKRMAV